MDMPFEIRFDFPLEHSLQIIPLRATVQLHHIEPYYIIDSFFFQENTTANNAASVSLLPPVELKCLKTNRQHAWVHKDSGRESLLSRAIGKAIEKSGKFTAGQTADG